MKTVSLFALPNSTFSGNFKAFNLECHHSKVVREKSQLFLLLKGDPSQQYFKRKRKDFPDPAAHHTHTHVQACIHAHILHLTKTSFISLNFQDQTGVAARFFLPFFLTVPLSGNIIFARSREKKTHLTH